MTPLGRSRHAIVAAVALLALLVTSGCGDDNPQAGRRTTPAANFDQALHNRLPSGILTRGTIRVGGGDPYPPASLFAADGRTLVGFEP
jgi:polar amino acid transport system substrate-binding protein